MTRYETRKRGEGQTFGKGCYGGHALGPDIAQDETAISEKGLLSSMYTLAGGLNTSKHTDHVSRDRSSALRVWDQSPRAGIDIGRDMDRTTAIVPTKDASLALG